ncbi:hypothetical protein [Leptolyngbya sp. FACHB-16]|uniref:hypothetical protein n=1 Tax=unclassified Leptolyngbya TaxID=2650499 RepID=UPI00168708B1|nr:hypothetical protein [Leptolyngbya sp. FACHB-16]MBD2156017.1 hypothetical protein [Leptolyngbya sp. FACHB-16]
MSGDRAFQLCHSQVINTRSSLKLSTNACHPWGASYITHPEAMPSQLYQCDWVDALG